MGGSLFTPDNLLHGLQDELWRALKGCEGGVELINKMMLEVYMIIVIMTIPVMTSVILETNEPSTQMCYYLLVVIVTHPC